MLRLTYQCNDCGFTFESEKTEYLCPYCSPKNKPDLPPLGVLKVLYDYNTIKKKGDQLLNSLIEEDFLSLLPIQSNKSLPVLRVGKTPLYRHRLAECELMIKDDSLNPTFSFKDRASAIVSAYAKENNIQTIVAASTGNAGSSLAGICAAQKQKAIIFVPAAAPKAKLTQIIMYGAQIVPVAGNYDQAFDLSIAVTEKYGFYNRNTAFNPLTIEGKKTVSFEVVQQMNGEIPDKILVPVGDGVIISGVYKGFEDLLILGVISQMPQIIAVQAEGSSNLVDNLNSESFLSKPSKTIADSISVDIPRNFYMARKFIKTYNGLAIKVSDEEILQASKALSSLFGIFSEPAASTAYAGFLRLQNQGMIKKGEKVLVLLTGSGLKDLNAVQSLLQMPSPVEATMTAVEHFLQLK
ncbi:MAG: threonine synthase [Bacteroidales bacterium]|nr:threonine synthase [Bacteroidales bacterium]